MLNSRFCSAILLALAQLCYSAANPKAYVSVDSSVRLQQEVAKEGTNEAALLSVDEANGEAAQSSNQSAPGSAADARRLWKQREEQAAGKS